MPELILRTIVRLGIPAVRFALQQRPRWPARCAVEYLGCFHGAMGERGASTVDISLSKA